MKLEYSLLVAETPAPRGERLNVGIIIWRDGTPEFLAGISHARLAALDPNFARLPIFRQLGDGTLAQALAGKLAALPDQATRMTMLEFLLKPIRVLTGGELFAEDGDFDPAIERLMNSVIRRPSLALPGKRRTSNRSQLTRQMKDWFRHARVMGRGMEDLARSRIVEQFPIAVEADVYADFAYRNGSLHVIETLDLRGADHMTTALRNNAAFKSITLDMAREVIGDGRRIGVIAASDYAGVKPAVRLFERNADDLFSLDSPNDMQRFADLLTRGLHIDGGLLQPADIG